MTAPRCNGSFEQVAPADAATIDPKDFGGRLELGGSGVATLERLQSGAQDTAQLANLIQFEVAEMALKQQQLVQRTLAIAQRYAGIARRIEAEVVEVLSRLQPDTDPAVATSLRVILNLLKLICQADEAAQAAAESAG